MSGLRLSYRVVSKLAGKSVGAEYDDKLCGSKVPLSLVSQFNEVLAEKQSPDCQQSASHKIIRGNFT